MNLKSFNYMKGTEFNERQLWLPFGDAVGMVLQIMAGVKQQAADWFRAWVREFRALRKVPLPEQQTFAFGSPFRSALDDLVIGKRLPYYAYA
ncbi:hypothetical protein [Candidatus Ferrigenium straubiae]|uniref:hypothetical protein n=1 Tax=Candidatus Ferrigenium straubiae TaxID=2919506 RepID=UPI003F4AF4C7